MNDERSRSLVLIVEDEAWLRELWAAELKEEGIGECVTAVGSPHAAVPILSSGRVCAAIIDIGLPEMSGESLIQIARGIDPRLSIVAVTGFDATHYRHLCCERVRVLQKPFRTSWLLFNLKALLAQHPCSTQRVAQPSGTALPAVRLRCAS